MNIFTYGTLMCEDIFESVTGCRLKRTGGRITGFKRLKLKNEHYPAIIAETDSAVDGYVYLDVERKSGRRLDLFEGKMYRRETVTVALDNGETVLAEVYVLKEDYFSLLDKEAWNFEEFLQHGKKDFTHGYQGYEAIR